MATLFDQQIDQTYTGLIKTTDNAVLGAVEKEITDGLGNSSTLKLGTTSASFVGTLDLTGATVTGLPDVDTTYTIGSVQDGLNADIKLTDQLGNQSKVTLVAGDNVTLTNSGNDLTIDAPDTNTTYSIGSVQDGLNADIVLTDQLGNTSKATLVAGTNITLTNVGNDLTIDASGGGGAAGLVSGAGADSMISASTLTTNPATAAGSGAVVLGDGANSATINGIAIGLGANAGNFTDYDRANIAIGKNASATNEECVVIGKTANATGDRTVSIGSGASASSSRGVAIGISTAANGPFAVAIGNYCNVTAEAGIAIGGYNNSVTATGGIVIGKESSATATGAIGLGFQVTASTVDTVTIKKLQMLDYATINFADDTAAAAAGIPLGGVYHTSGALKIRIA